MLSLALLGACAPKVEEQSFQLGNGLAVELIGASKGESAAVGLSFAVGADHDPPGRSGMSHLAARVFLTAPVAGGAPRTQAALEREGWSARAGQGFTAFAARVPASALSTALDDLGARLAALDPKEADLARERPAVLEEIKRLRGGDAEASAETFAAESVAASRGGGWRGGVAKEVEAITAEELAAFVRGHLKAGSARLVVAGRLDLKAVRKQVEAAFGAADRGAQGALRPPATSRVSGTLVMGDAPSTAALAVAAPRPEQPAYPAFVLLAARLVRGGGEGWKAKWDPLARPEVLLVTGPLLPDERPDDAGARLRKAVAAVVGAKRTEADAQRAKEAFGAALELSPVTVAGLQGDPLPVAWARAQGPQLGVDKKALALALGGVTDAQLAEAAAHFDPKQGAVVVAGGAIP